MNDYTEQHESLTDIENSLSDIEQNDNDLYTIDDLYNQDHMMGNYENKHNVRYLRLKNIISGNCILWSCLCILFVLIIATIIFMLIYQ